MQTSDRWENNRPIEMSYNIYQILPEPVPIKMKTIKEKYRMAYSCPTCNTSASWFHKIDFGRPFYHLFCHKCELHAREAINPKLAMRRWLELKKQNK